MFALDVIAEPEDIFIDILEQTNAGVWILAILGVAVVCIVSVFLIKHFKKKRNK